MKLEFFPKLALDGIRKNKRLYTPYLLACTGMVAMLYIITFLSQSPLVFSARGGRPGDHHAAEAPAGGRADGRARLERN